MKILESETNSEFTTSSSSSVLLQSPVYVTHSPPPPPFRTLGSRKHTQTIHSSFNSTVEQLRNANSWDSACTRMGRVCCSRDWTSPGRLQNKQTNKQTSLSAFGILAFIIRNECVLDVHLESPSVSTGRCQENQPFPSCHNRTVIHPPTSRCPAGKDLTRSKRLGLNTVTLTLF